MDDLNIKQMTLAAKTIAEEKNLPEETVFRVIEMAIAAAWRRENGKRDQNVRAELDTNSGQAEVFVQFEVVEDGEAYNPLNEIALEDAKEIDEKAEVGEIVEEKHTVETFGRVAAQTAKQVILQRLREAEREIVLEEYEDKVGAIVSGTVAKVDQRVVRIDLGKATGILPLREQIQGEYYSPGQRVKVLIKEIEREGHAPELILSRGDPRFIEILFGQEVPELEGGMVEIVSLTREAGRRTKMAVKSNTPGVDPVGTFVGGRGVRVQAVMNEIGDREKIDIVTWSSNPSEFIREALSPAEIVEVKIDEERKRAQVIVAEDQQSIAIGRAGQNVRLASRLTGYELDIELAKPETKKPRGNVEDVLFSALNEATETEVIEQLDGDESDQEHFGGENQ
ncbi:transcription termination/antitermination protein NusA [Candidatus Saccharibacteria bacterium]|jgi:N utilization substance protein A|nr:transcription termination/antitermination protein NusA [Candidatus Saccharibacteria bacterium]